MKFTKTLLALALATSTSAMAYQANKTYKFTVLHTNDIHGHFWNNNKGEYGLSAQKNVVDQIRNEVEKKGGSVIILNAGDVNTGVPESDMQNARPDIEGLNEIGYEAMVLGNHEFDSPLQILTMQEKWAKFPFISANVVNKQTEQPLVKPYIMLNKNGLKVAVVGLTTEDTAKLGNPDVVGKVVFKKPIQTAEKTLKQINKKEKPDVRIALTHMGWYLEGKHGTNAPGDVSMARQLPKGSFDMIIGGHTHEDGTREYKLYAEEIQPDAVLHAKLKKYQDEGDKTLGVIVGKTDGFFNGKREAVRFEQTNLGRLIAQSQMERVKADIGIMNSGGVRASLPEGDVSYKDILTVQPFGNMISTLDLKGQELVDFLTIVALKQTDTGGYPQLAGISMVVDRSTKTISDVKIGGQPLDMNKTYKVSIPDYLTGGGDGYPVMKNHPTYVNTGFIDAEMLKKYFEENKVLKATDYDPREDVIFKN